MGALETLIESTVGAATLALPALIGAAATWGVMWFRLRKARLRAERMQFPPSSEPPRPPWWKSIRPSFRARARELEPRAPDPEVAAELERAAHEEEENTPAEIPMRRLPRRPPPQ